MGHAELLSIAHCSILFVEQIIQEMQGDILVRQITLYLLHYLFDKEETAVCY